MFSKQIGFLTFLLWLVIPGAAFGQIPSWLNVSPGAVYQAPGSPSCFTITVGGGAYMIVDLEYYFEYSGPNYFAAGLDGNGQTQICADASIPAGFYEITGVQNAYYPIGYVPVYSNLYVNPAPPPPPVIYGLGPGCGNWDCIWVGGANFQQNSFVYVYSADWSTYQVFWGPPWGYSPALWVDLPYLSFRITDPTTLSSFGNGGVFVMVVNPDWTHSGWAYTHSQPPVISSAGPSCADGYCISLTGSFPLDAVVDFRIPGQPDVIPNAYTDLNVTASAISLRLNPSVRHDFDVSGLNAWVVNPPMANWSDGYYIAPVDRAVIGNIEGIAQSGSQYYLYGWACAKTYAGSVGLQVYVGGPAGTGTFAFAGTANQSSNPATTATCNTGGTSYGFSIPLSLALRQQFGGQAIFVYGISPFGLPNSLLDNSGNLTFPPAVATSSKEYIYIGDRLLAVDTTNLP